LVDVSVEAVIALDKSVSDTRAEFDSHPVIEFVNTVMASGVVGCECFLTVVAELSH
jgi:hypothetical protein